MEIEVTQQGILPDDEEFAIEDSDQLTESEVTDVLEAEPTAAAVTYSGQDFDVSGLVRRLSANDIMVPSFGHEDDRISSAGFQRSFVWRRPQMDRFIESLLLGYPIPGIFLVRQLDRRYLVLDGQQRLRTLQHFIDGIHDGVEFALQNVSKDFKNLTYKSLSEDDKRLFDDTFIQATIVATDGSSESLEAIYQIFERLNSGGTQLTPHEIRVALYAGQFIDWLERLNISPDWRALYGRKSPRLRDQELILRVIALTNDSASYKKPLKSFLNAFVSRHRSLPTAAAATATAPFDKDELTSRFLKASELIRAADGHAALRPRGTQLNAALAEAVFVGMMRRGLDTSPVSSQKLKDALLELRDDKALQIFTTSSTADEESVRSRLDIATARLAAV